MVTINTEAVPEAIGRNILEQLQMTERLFRADASVNIETVAQLIKEAVENNQSVWRQSDLPAELAASNILASSGFYSTEAGRKLATPMDIVLTAAAERQGQGVQITAAPAQPSLMRISTWPRSKRFASHAAMLNVPKTLLPTFSGSSSSEAKPFFVNMSSSS